MRGLKHSKMKRSSSVGDFFGSVGKIIVICAVLVVLFVVVTNLLFSNKTKLDYESRSLPKQYIGTKIAHVAGIYNQSLGDIKSVIKKEKPDLIVVTGGLVDSKGGYEKTAKILTDLNNIAPTLVSGDATDADVFESIMSQTQAVSITGDVTVLEPSKPMTFDKYIEDVKGRSTDEEEFKIYSDYVKSKFESDSQVKISLAGLGVYDNVDSAKSDLYELEKKAYGTYKMLMIPQLGYFEELSKQTYDLMFANNCRAKKDSQYKNGIYALNGTSISVTSGVNYDERNEKKMIFVPKVSIITLSDGIYGKDTFFDKLSRVVIKDTGSIFEDDDFKAYKHSYGDVDDMIKEEETGVKQ